MTVAQLEELNGRWLNHVELAPDPAPQAVTAPRLYRPLSEAIGGYVDWAQNDEDRIYTGIQALDYEMRGTAPGELTMVQGFSHSGKTLVLSHMLHHNHAVPTLYMQPDEPNELTLVKLACVTFGRDGRKLEAAVASGDQEVINLLHETANTVYPHLAVIDAALTPSSMEKAWEEVSEAWGMEPRWVIVDFLDLLDGFEMTPQRANFVKSFGREHRVPMTVLHQMSRSSGADGKEVTISGGAYGGETQSTHIIGVRRKRFELAAKLRELRKKNPTDSVVDQISEAEYELGQHEHTLTVNLVKCKRVGSSLVDELDFDIAPGSGVIRPHEFRQGTQQWQQDPMEEF